MKAFTPCWYRDFCKEEGKEERIGEKGRSLKIKRA